MTVNYILPGNCIDTLKTLPDCSVDCCVTSPPYFHLRNYNNISGQIGLEDTPGEYIENLTAVFREVYRVLKKQGTCWVVIGDSYSSSGKDSGNTKKTKYKLYSNMSGCMAGKHKVKTLPPKCLTGIPWRFAFAMMDSGWILRQDIVWSKPNPMPESVKDRFCKSHEYIFFFTKSGRYYFDHNASLEKALSYDKEFFNVNLACPQRKFAVKDGFTELKDQRHGISIQTMALRTKRDVWQIPTGSSAIEHYAMFPQRLILPCILCGCPQNGIVLDPFMGIGTTAIAAMKNLRKFIGCEINPGYIKIAEQQIAAEKGLFDVQEAAG